MKRQAQESEEEEPANVERFDVTYKDLMAKIVCDTTNLECMVHRCDNCPGFPALEKFVKDKFAELDIDEEVKYSQWANVDRSILNSHTSDVDYFIDLLVYSVDNLTTHSFIAKSQAQYLKKRKEEMNESECIILLDFAENYHYVVQDEIQGYHWNKDQCTLHPVVIYYKENGELKHFSLCILSDDLEHDTSFVHELQRRVMHFIKEKLPQVTSVLYFSDGCSGQYKSFKASLNLCHHKIDFQLDAEWGFFATSHGKSPCDGIGGTVKRKVLRASLQRPVSNQILTFSALVEYCDSSIQGIEFMVITKEEMVPVREKLNSRYQLGDTVPGSRSAHHFIPTSQYTIQKKQLSVDATIFIDHSFVDMPPPQDETVQVLKKNDYVTCCFDGHWWVALIDAVHKEERDFRVVSSIHMGLPNSSTGPVRKMRDSFQSPKSS